MNIERKKEEEEREREREKKKHIRVEHLLNLDLTRRSAEHGLENIGGVADAVVAIRTHERRQALVNDIQILVKVKDCMDWRRVGNASNSNIGESFQKNKQKQ